MLSKISFRKKKKTIFLVCFILVAIIVYYHNVSKSITRNDVTALKEIFGDSILLKDINTFDEQIVFITNAQRILHAKYTVYKPIPFNEYREPQNLIKIKHGVCHDYSRTLEKLFMYKGFKTRHVAVYSHLKTNKYLCLFVSKTPSHSLTEVKTKKGWMIVDSNMKFIALDINSNPISYKTINAQTNFRVKISDELSLFYTQPHIYIYGLYSRHGKFYSPFNFIPDYNFCELFYNFSIH